VEVGVGQYVRHVIAIGFKLQEGGVGRGGYID